MENLLREKGSKCFFGTGTSCKKKVSQKKFSNWIRGRHGRISKMWRILKLVFQVLSCHWKDILLSTLVNYINFNKS